MEETRHLTDAAERIKAGLSHENWDRQTRWTAKRDLYVQIAQALGGLRTGYIEWKGLERLRLSPVSDQKYRAELEEKRKEAMRNIEQARLTFLHATDTAPLMVTDEPFKPLREYKPRQIRFETPHWEADLEYNIVSSQWALYHFQTAARADLGFEPMIWKPTIITDGPPVEDGSRQNS